MSKQSKTYAAIFENPIRANIKWKDIESLLEALGAELSEGSGSRLRIVLNGYKATIHRPHPGKEAKRSTIGYLREFLEDAGADTGQL